MSEPIDIQTLLAALRTAEATSGASDPCDPAQGLCVLADWLLRMEADLTEQTQLLRTVLDESPDFIVLKDHEGHFLLCNQPVADFYGTTPQAMVGKHDGHFSATPEQAEFFRRNVLDIMARGQTEVVFEEARDASTGRISYFKSIKKPFCGPDGRMRILVIAHDISDMRRAQIQVEESERRLRYALQATGDGVWDWDLPSGSLTLSRRWCEIFGYEPSELSGMQDDFLRCVPENERPEIDRRIHACLAGDGVYEHEHRMRRKDGQLIWVLDRGRVVERDAAGVPRRMVGSVADITDKRIAHDQIRHQASYDPLTGLFNRTTLHQHLEHEMRVSDRTGHALALMILDVDDFKGINDSLGHSQGDVLLQSAAARLRACVRAVDAVGRLGGDEFTVVVGGLSGPDDAVRVAHEMLKAMAEPFDLGSESVYVSASIGITFYPSDAASADDLLRNADQAMYDAKRAGRNRCRFFTPALHTAAQEHLRLVGDLRGALANQQFHLCYQPVVDLNSGQIHKAEALVRWTHPVRGLVNPATFIPVVESSGLIHALGDWVFREATKQAARWRHLCPDFQVSVNVSPIQFQNDRLDLRAWLAHLQALGVDGRCVAVEITEGLLMEAGPNVTASLLGFRDAGVQVALDDFGTGYSSLSYLNKLDIDYIKIDRSFVSDLSADSPVLALCEGIVVMAHKLGLKVVAEGIETAEQLALLRAAGCDFGQGYLFSRPVPALQFERLLTDVPPVVFD